MLYKNHRRPILRAEHPELTLTDLSKLIGEEWKKLNELQKKPWEERAKSMRLEYEIKCYNAKRAPDAESGDSNPKRQKIAETSAQKALASTNATASSPKK